jgi:hypothetical protein
MIVTVMAGLLQYGSWFDFKDGRFTFQRHSTLAYDARGFIRQVLKLRSGRVPSIFRNRHDSNSLGNLSDR